MNVQLMSRTFALGLLSLCTSVAEARVDDGGHAACSEQFIEMLTTRGVPAAVITDQGPIAAPRALDTAPGTNVRRWTMKAEQGGELVAKGSCVVSARSGEVRRLTLVPGPAMPAALTTAAR